MRLNNFYNSFHQIVPLIKPYSTAVHGTGLPTHILWVQIPQKPQVFLKGMRVCISVRLSYFVHYDSQVHTLHKN